jgi:thiol-disulfide isomerase/thioredoxin
LIAALLLWAPLAGRAGGLKLPAPAPTLRLTDIDGKLMDLAGLKGRVVLLDFWATWCGPCRDEAPALKALQASLGPQGLTILGLSLDETPGPVKKFRRELGLNYSIAMADLSTTARFGGVLGLPTLYLVDRRGIIVQRFHDGASRASLEASIKKALGPSPQ